MIGRTLGNYRIVEQIGMGGMATVYKAYDPDTDRYVAIKILPQQFSKDPTFRERFQREAKAIAKLEHIHILPIFSYGEDDDTVYMAMRYLRAGSLTERIRARPMPLHEASRLLGQIAGALDHAHSHGVLHRDVKPSNVLLDTDNNAFLTDFGIAKMVESTIDLTGAGILGTPAYMSPEQCVGSKELTPASDQYSLGIVLYEMVTGRAPFQAETPIALIHMQLNEPLPPPRQLRSDLPEDAQRVILKALAKDPESRYQTCGAMAAAFAQAVAAIAPAAAAEEVTIPHIASPLSPKGEVTTPQAPPGPTAIVGAKLRRVPGWALAALALLIVVGLIGVAMAVDLISFEQETETPLAEEQPLPTAKDVWNFESGDAQEWTLDAPAWQVVPVGDGYALEARGPETEGDDTPRSAHPPGWAADAGDFLLSFRLKLEAGALDIFLRSRPTQSECDELYNLLLQVDTVTVASHRQHCGPSIPRLGDVPTPLVNDKWSLVEIVALGEHIDLIINGQHILSLRDEEPIPAGSLGFASNMPDTHLYLDDISLSPITPPQAQARLSTATGKPTLLVMASPAAPAQTPPELITKGEPGEILFEDSFDGPPSRRWQFFPKPWITESIEGRSVLHNVPAAERPSAMEIRETGWSDYAIQFDFRFLEPDRYGEHYFFVRTRLHNCPPTVKSLEGYVVLLSPDVIELRKETCDAPGGQPTLARSDRNLAPDRWHSLELVVVGSRVRLALDGQNFIDYVDDDRPLLGGDVIVETQNNVEFLLDNFRVTEIIPGEAQPPPEQEAAPVEQKPAPEAAQLLAATDQFWPGRNIEPADWAGDGSGLYIHPWGIDAQPILILADSKLYFVDAPAWSPDGRRIAFTAAKTEDAPAGIYVANADGSDLTRLPVPGYNVAPAWSPNGKWLAVENDGNLALVHPDGSDLQIILNHKNKACSNRPQWSPDGERLVVSTLLGCEWETPMTREIQVLSRSGESLRPLISITHEDPDCVDFATAFSPDGSQIAYIDEACQAHLLNADGAGQPVPMNRFPWEWRSNFYPQWLNSKYANACRHTNLGGAGLCLTASETESVTRILEDANLDFEQFNGYSWRPDGQQLVFSATEPESPINNLYIVNADGSNLVQLPLPPHELANEPVWSPNGQWLAFHLDGQLAKMRPDGSDLTILYDDYGCFGRPEWSPDSRRLVMTVQTAPAFCEYAFPRTLEMLSIAADGGKIMTITAETYAQECGEEWRIAISPNGQWVAYFNGNCQTQLIRADGSGQPRPLKEFPWWWTSQLFPQWGGQNK